MANELDLQLGAPAAGWNVYFVLFSGGLVWDGSDFVTDSTANRNAGAIAATETPALSSRFLADMPSGVTASGTYPVIGYRRLGGSPSTATDTVVTLNGSYVEYVNTAGSNLIRSPAEVIQQLLIDGGLTTEGGQEGQWPCWSDREPDDTDGPIPDEIVVVYDTQGVDDLRTMIDGKLYTHHGIQLLIRAATKGRGYAKAMAARNYLAEAIRNTYTTVVETRYLVHAVTKIGDVIPIGTDPGTSKRTMFTVNATVAMTMVTT